jgi:hypothetical protein
LAVDAACRLELPDGGVREFFLTCPCIGERMYVESGLIHEPPFEFLMIAEHQAEYAIVRRHFDAPEAPYECHRFGEAMSTQSGVPARVTALDVFPAPLEGARRVATYDDFRDALLGNRPLVGTTRYVADDGETKITLRYPAKTVNVAHGQEAWQVDAGPLLMPDPRASLGAGGLLCGAFHIAYLVFNRLDRAETVVRTAPPMGSAPDGAFCTVHPGDARAFAAHTELYAAPAPVAAPAAENG